MINYNDECKCQTPGEDDGNTTCWAHHDCRAGDCTHQDGADYEDDTTAVDREEDCAL